MPKYNHDRRTFLKSAGGILAITAVAGCLGGNDDEPQPEDRNDGGGSGNDGGGDDGYDFGDWFDGVSNYDGVADLTGESSVTAMVGTDDGFAYDPPAIRIDVGTTVVWEWTGDGGAHDVIEDDGAFESELLTAEGATFEHTFDAEGVYKYYCSPHIAMGMKGAVVVE